MHISSFEQATILQRFSGSGEAFRRTNLKSAMQMLETALTHLQDGSWRQADALRLQAISVVAEQRSGIELEQLDTFVGIFPIKEFEEPDRELAARYVTALQLEFDHSAASLAEPLRLFFIAIAKTALLRLGATQFDPIRLTVFRTLMRDDVSSVSAFLRLLRECAISNFLSGDLEFGVALGKRAFRLSSMVFGPGHAETGASLHCLGVLEFRRSSYRRAKSFLEQAAFILTRSGGSLMVLADSYDILVDVCTELQDASAENRFRGLSRRTRAFLEADVV